MKEIGEKDAARLVSMVYRPSLIEEINEIEEQHHKCSMKDLIPLIKKEIEESNDNAKFGGEMTKQVFCMETGFYKKKTGISKFEYDLW